MCHPVNSYNWKKFKISIHSINMQPIWLIKKVVWPGCLFISLSFCSRNNSKAILDRWSRIIDFLPTDAYSKSFHFCQINCLCDDSRRQLHTTHTSNFNHSTRACFYKKKLQSYQRSANNYHFVWLGIYKFKTFRRLISLHLTCFWNVFINCRVPKELSKYISVQV